MRNRAIPRADYRSKWSGPARPPWEAKGHGFGQRAAWLASLVKRGAFTRGGVLRRDIWDPQHRVLIRAAEDRRLHREGVEPSKPRRKRRKRRKRA